MSWKLGSNFFLWQGLGIFVLSIYLSILENPKDFLPTNPQPLISQRKTRGVFKMNLCCFSIFFFTVPDGNKRIRFQNWFYSAFEFHFPLSINLPLRSASCRREGNFYFYLKFRFANHPDLRLKSFIYYKIFFWFSFL